MNPHDVIETVQTDFAARLQSLDYFRDVYVAAPRLWKEGEKLHTPKSITDKVDQALTGLIPTNGKVGAAVRIFQPTLYMKKTNGREALLLLVCRCEVNPIINVGPQGTNKNVSHIAYNVLRAGQGFTLMQGFCTLFADGECFLPYVSEDAPDKAGLGAGESGVALRFPPQSKTPWACVSAFRLQKQNLCLSVFICGRIKFFSLPRFRVPGAWLPSGLRVCPGPRRLCRR